ncbi:MAG: hypothetical protein K0S37_3408 [Microbacterium sp.]|jgi:hypothetical protein|nr:hypothetical protein [Microbacterium sp.]
MLPIMRIAVAGTHGSGKSTLINDFLDDQPGFTALAEPYEFLDEMTISSDATGFRQQLTMSARLLGELPDGTDVIVERSPLDFVAYLLALDELGRTRLSAETLTSVIAVAERALSAIDVLVVLPLEQRPGLEAAADEDVQLREAMDRQLVELVDEYATDQVVIELTGSQEERRRTLTQEIARLHTR